MGIRLAALLLCVVLVATFVDALPDPPAINPPRVENHARLSVYSHRAASAVLLSNGFLFARPVFLICISLLPSFEPRGPFRWSLVLVRHATDVSPPACV